VVENILIYESALTEYYI